MDGNGSIRVFLLDDHEMVRRGVHQLLSGGSGDGRAGGDGTAGGTGNRSEAAAGTGSGIAAGTGIEVVGEAANAAEAMADIPAAHPDVALLDVRLPDGSGVEVCRDIRSHDPSVKCLMLTSFADDEALFDAVMAGASGYVPKVIRGEELTAAVRAVAAGQSLLTPEATEEVLERVRAGGLRSADPGSGGGGRLTEEERRIVDLIGDGLTNRQIGERLGMPEKTVKARVAGVLEKLGMEPRRLSVRSRTRFRQPG